MTFLEKNVVLPYFVKLLKFSGERVVVQFEDTIIEIPAWQTVKIDKSYFTELITCPPQCSSCCGRTGMHGTCLVGIEGLKVDNKKVKQMIVSVNGKSLAVPYTDMKPCPFLFDNRCIFGGNREKFFERMPFVCVLCPGTYVSIRNNTLYLRRRRCKYSLPEKPDFDINLELVFWKRMEKFYQSIGLSMKNFMESFGRRLDEWQTC
jgi:hypothetical protein